MAWQAVIALLCLAVCQVNGQDPAQMCTGIGGEVKDCSACNGGCIKDQNIDTPLGCCVGNNLINPNQCSAMMGIVKDSCSACSNQSCATLSSDKACCFERPDTPSVEDVKKCAAAKGIIKECKDCDTGCFSGENGGSMGCCIPTVTADMCQRDGKLGTTCNDCEDDQECAHLPENRVCCLPEAEDADVKMCTDNGGMIKDCSNCTGGCVRDMGESMGCCFGERLTSSGECTGMLGLVKESCSNCADQLCSTLTDEQNKACCFEREWEEDMRKCAKAGGQTTECDTCSTGCFKGDSDGPFGCCIPTVTATMCQQHGKLGSSCDDCEDEDECAHLPGNSICCLPKAQDGEGMCDLENLLAFIAKNPSTYACLQNMNSLFDGTISKQDACGVFWDGMQCFTQLYLQGSMGTITQAACFKDLKDDIMEEKDGYQKIRRALIKEFRMAIIVPGFVATKCEESWNVPCPMLERDEDSGLCPQECGSASSCGDGKVCCPFSCGEDSSGNLCAPDMTKCANVDDITTYAFSCIELFGKLIGESDFESFCKYSWGGFECVARELVGDPYKDMCLRRMAHLVEASPDIIVQQIKLLAPGLDIDQALANRTASCPQNPMSLKKETPVADDVKSCGDAAQIRQAFNRGKCRAPGSSEINEDNCEAFEDMLECVAERLIGDDDDNAGKLRGRCMNTIVQVIKDNFFQFKEILSSGPFNHEKCREMAAVCMGDTKPSETANCRGNSKCPKGFNCVAGYCCPQANAGVCPTYKDQIPPCRGRCKQDSDCDDEEKCCNVGCNGGMTCVPAEIEDQSKCEKEFGQVKMLLENMGVCGDGVSDLQIPRCQDKKFHPTQGRYCVDENGEKIPGSEHMGVKDCTRVHAGMCQAMPAVCKNLGTPNKTNSIINCENDGECADNEKCCMDGSSNVCEVKCMPALSAETNRQADEDCANPVCCPVTTCLGKVCAADVTAVCQIHACGECTAKFYNKDGEVDCEAGVKKCVKERFSALEHNSKIGKTTRDKLNTLIESLRKRGSGENKKDADDMDDMEDEMDDMMDDDFMDGEDMTDVAEEYRQKVAYILKKMPKDPSHGTISFDMKKHSKCNRDKEYVMSIKEQIETAVPTKYSVIMSKMIAFYGVPDRILPSYNCASDGSYNEVQTGIFHTKDKRVEVHFCVNTTTEYCLLEKDAGYGDRIVGRYFYDATSRTCKRFAYFGMGGNQNRFETLHQCHTECGPRSYKYDDVTCPSPDAVRKSLSGMKSYSTCDSDDQCMEGEVCGSDGMTYGSECMLRRHACMMMQTIKVASTQPCAAPQTCNGKRDVGTSVETTPEPAQCGNTQCSVYQDCIDGMCKCSNICPLIMDPVCAFKPNNPDQKKTFANECVMRRAGCNEAAAYMIYERGACVKPEPMLKCPEMDMDIPHSSEFACNIDNNERCDDDTEMCCPYGTGSHCVPKSGLAKKDEVKEGFCPMITVTNFDEGTCADSSCDVDADCAGNMKCCMNDVCTHMTCVLPRQPRANVCGNGKKPVGQCDPLSTEPCADGGSCNSTVIDGMDTGVCCVSSEAATRMMDMMAMDKDVPDDVCLTVPNLEESCDDTSVTRYYYNHDMSRCEAFADMGYGDTVTPQRDGLLKMCPNGGSPKLCENGGLPCNDCQMPQAGEGEDDEDDGETTDKRLRGQGRAIGRGEYSKRRSIDQIVQCEVTDRLLDGGQGAAPASKQYRCSEGGSFEALCEGNACFCVNATDGSKIGGAKSGDIDSIDCEQEQKRSKPKYVKVKGIVAKNKNLADLSAKAQQQIIDQIRKIIEEKGGRATIKLMDGSIIYEATIEEDGSGTDMNGGVEIMTDEGVIEIPTGTSSIAEFIIAEPTTEKPPPNKDEKDDKTVIIIVVVVVCYKKSKKTDDKDMQFSNI
ncbi:VKTB-like protein [Mya arenaria]|uniref:VKTB-like protein n=1 Tax=Mya arenaria TaxID=6604 RepID=A0ABY7G9E4_MYAAR|nr:VKTB-like protein [Mya arenaria]